MTTETTQGTDSKREACPSCASEKTELITLDGAPWWVCRFQGCTGRISGDWLHWKPGQGATPKPPKAPKVKKVDAAAKPAQDA